MPFVAFADFCLESFGQKKKTISFPDLVVLLENPGATDLLTEERSTDPGPALKIYHSGHSKKLHLEVCRLDVGKFHLKDRLGKY